MQNKYLNKNIRILNNTGTRIYLYLANPVSPSAVTLINYKKCLIDKLLTLALAAILLSAVFITVDDVYTLLAVALYLGI